MKLSFISFQSLLHCCAVLTILCLVGCKQPHENVAHDVSVDMIQNENVAHDVSGDMIQSFPQDLLYQGVPIHPLCIITAITGDKLPQSIRIEDLQPNLPDHYDVKRHTLSYNLEKKRCDGSWEKMIDEDYWVSDYGDYTYIGSYKNKHVVQTSMTYAYSRYTDERLVVIMREKDTIRHVGDICTSGDFYNVVLENNILKFDCSSPALCTDVIMPRESIADSEKEIVCIANDLSQFRSLRVFGSFYEVDLDDDLLISTLGGILLFQRRFYDGWSRNEKRKGFNEVALRYIEAGHERLNLAQTELFIKDVWKSIAEKIALNECGEK